MGTQKGLRQWHSPFLRLTPRIALCFPQLLLAGVLDSGLRRTYLVYIYNDVHFELELSGQLTDAGCPEKGWCAPPHQQKDQSVIYYP